MSPHDLHLLAAVPWDLELPQPGHLQLRPALTADEVDVQVLDVLRLGGAGPSSTEGGV